MAMPEPSRSPRPISEEFLDRYGDRPEFLQRLFAVFLEEEPKRIARIRAAVAAGDREQVRFLAHSLQGSAAAMGMAPLGEACRVLEAAAREGEPANALRSDCLAVEREMTAVFAALRARLS